MKYQYSICHPDKYDIEYPTETLDRYQVKDMVETYPWLKILKSMEKMPSDKINYSPSLDFTNIKSNHSFCLTAELKDEKIEFSLWYNRPIKSKILFGLLGYSTVLKVVDKWSFNKESAFENLQLFLDKNYISLEKIMTS